MFVIDGFRIREFCGIDIDKAQVLYRKHKQKERYMDEGEFWSLLGIERQVSHMNDIEKDIFIQMLFNHSDIMSAKHKKYILGKMQFREIFTPDNLKVKTIWKSFRMTDKEYEFIMSMGAKTFSENIAIVIMKQQAVVNAEKKEENKKEIKETLRFAK